MSPEEVQAAVDTARREGFERGASPSVGALLAEIQMAEGGEEGTYLQGYQDGLTKAVRTLILADVANYQDAWKAGWRAGMRAAGKEPGA